ncbi:tenascin-R-like [Branchiostoma floridae x Branchiostoma japonicum]
MLDVDGFACSDFNECNTANGGCGQFCNNTIGSFNCYCATGYSLRLDGFTCTGFGPVSQLSCTFTTTTSISITWIEPVPDVKGYDIIYIPTHGFFQPSPKTHFRSPGDTTATISGLFSGVQYSLSVFAFGLWNDSANVSTECITGLPPPINISLSLASRESVVVRWSKPARTLVLGYRVWLTDKETMIVASSRHLPQSAVSAAFTSLVPATEYVVAVSCISTFVQGPQADVTIITETDPPFNLFVDDVRDSRLALFWTPPVAKLIGYELQIDSTGQRRKRRSTSTITLPGSSDSYLIQDLVPATQYVLSLTAVSRFARSTAMTTTGITDTDPPSDFKVQKVSSSWMSVKWTPPVAVIVSYHLEVIEDASQDEMHFTIPSTLTAFNITALDPTTKYTILLAAVSMYGRSDVVEIYGSTVSTVVAEYSRTTTTQEATTTTTDRHVATTDTFWLNQLHTTLRTGSTPAVNQFRLELLETTTMSPTTEFQLQKDASTTPVKTPASGYNREYRTSQTTLSLLQTIQRMKDRVGELLVEETSSEDVLTTAESIKNLFLRDSFLHLTNSSSEFPLEVNSK